jgi:radical SAM superfamily enzyme YgiQ (UPF0313 family)
VPPSVYIVNPVADFPGYFGGEVFAARGLRPATLTADLALPTLAALAPRDFQVQLCDEAIAPVDFSTSADYVAITGKVTQHRRMVELAGEFRRRGKIVLIGGPHASLAPAEVRPHCDILVRGEIEEIAEQLFADLRERRWQDEYEGGKPDLRLSPVPRWDLYPNARAMAATVQTSRGCPFGCEFCDVIQYLGRKQRYKPIAQVLAELDEVHRHGYRSVFLADDNFTAWRGRAKELLIALRVWNDRQTDGRVQFSTQLSVDAAEDDELLRLCADAGLTYVFIGLETPNEASLREARKRQNLRRDPVEQVERFLRHGIMAAGGMIAGFDADGPDIFQRQLEFAMALRVPLVSAGALVAPRATPLYARLASEDRLLADGPEVAAQPWATNIVPRQMTRDTLLGGMRWLCSQLYAPAVFEERLMRSLQVLGTEYVPQHGGRWRPRRTRRIDWEAAGLAIRVSQLGLAEARMVARIVARASLKSRLAVPAARALLQYQQVRYMLERGGILDWRMTRGQPRLAMEAGTTCAR